MYQTSHQFVTSFEKHGEGEKELCGPYGIIHLTKVTSFVVMSLVRVSYHSNLQNVCVPLCMNIYLEIAPHPLNRQGGILLL